MCFTVDNCCCCFSLELGTKMIGILYTVSILIVFMLLFFRDLIQFSEPAYLIVCKLISNEPIQSLASSADLICHIIFVF